MDRAPLPPHERTWRHPSELAAEQRALLSAEGAAPSARAFALVTGTLGLLAVGALLLTVTPARQDSPIALGASTTLASLGTPELTVAPTALSPVGPTGALANPDRSLAPGHDTLATPIGDGRFGLVTSAALAGHAGATLSVRFTSGRVGVVEVVERSEDELVLVALPAGETGHPIAIDTPTADEIVTVMATPPITVPYAEVATLEVEEGTPVFDDAGGLVGLCSRGSGVVLVIEPPDELAAGQSGPATTVASATSVTTAPTSVAPSTTLVTTTTTTTVPESSTTVTTLVDEATTTVVEDLLDLSLRD